MVVYSVLRTLQAPCYLNAKTLLEAHIINRYKKVEISKSGGEGDARRDCRRSRPGEDEAVERAQEESFEKIVANQVQQRYPDGSLACTPPPPHSILRVTPVHASVR